MKQLIEAIHSVVRLSEKEEAVVQHYFSLKKIKKGAFFIKEQQYCNHIAFLQKGRLRVFYADENANEITCYFVEKNRLISSFTSFLTRTPTKENIEAIEDCILYVINRDDLEQLSIEIPKIQIWRRVIAENLFILMEKRVSMLQSQTAQERYEKVLQDNPDLILNVPLQYTASFLGMTPQHLSRLRKKQAK